MHTAVVNSLDCEEPDGGSTVGYRPPLDGVNVPFGFWDRLMSESYLRLLFYSRNVETLEQHLREATRETKLLFARQLTPKLLISYLLLRRLAFLRVRLVGPRRRWQC